MSGTLEGGRKAAITNKRKYGEDFYRTLGVKGGGISRGGGFASMEPAKRSAAGRKGGLKSRKPVLYGSYTHTFKLTPPEPKRNLFTKLKLRIFK